MQNSGPGPADTRNVIIAVVLSAAILFGFEFFYNAPQRERQQDAERARIEAQIENGEISREEAEAQGPAAPLTREEALAATSSARVAIDTPTVDGSISLQGARIDDLNLRQYNRTIEPESGEVSLLAPYDSEHGYDAFFGWEDREPGFYGVGANDVWQAEETAQLTPETPVTLTFSSGDGLEVTRTISIDDRYMFTITDEVRNAGEATRAVRPFGVVRRQGLPQDFTNNGIVHQGFAGAFGPRNRLHTETYRNAEKHSERRERGRVGEDQRLVQEQGEGGWLGISDHYWLTALIPDQAEPISGYFDASARGADNDFRAAYRGGWREIRAGESVTYTQRLFSGAKVFDTLRDYQGELNIPKLDEAIDWGNLMWPLTRPFFQYLLHPLAQWAAGLGTIYHFGIALLLSTIVIKLLLFPLVYHSFKAMAKMRALQPKMKEIQERYAADKQRQQQEMLRLYQTEKINPVSGCLPILLQIPVFFALYKTLNVTIEMRHAPFWGWIDDLSARDPTSLFNLFGLLPFDPGAIPLIGGVLMIGAWAVLYGISMWALQGLSPPPADPTQAMIFRWLPVLFLFLFAGFPAGLVIYWTWSNVISIAQQYVIMRRQGVETQLDKFIAKRMKREPTAAE